MTDHPDWADWSLARLEEAALTGRVFINDVVYAETSIRYSRMEELDTMLAEAEIDIALTPRSALFVAGKAFQQYRTADGTRTGVLPDFFVGAHPTVERWALLTRDGARCRAYFPKLTVIARSGGQHE